MRRTVITLLCVVGLFVGCTRPPYSKPDTELATVENDYTDCFSKASLAVNTPPFPQSPISQREQDTGTCMGERGYQKHFQLY